MHIQAARDALNQALQDYLAACQHQSEQGHSQTFQTNAGNGGGGGTQGFAFQSTPPSQQQQRGTATLPIILPIFVQV